MKLRVAPRRMFLKSLRFQLLIWVALPAAIVLLIVSIVEIRGHEHAMQSLIQERTDSAAGAAAALVNARVDRGQDALLQIASALTTRDSSTRLGQRDSYANLLDTSLFSAGLVLLEQNGSLLLTESEPPQLQSNEVIDLKAMVLSSGMPATMAIQSESAPLIVAQAVPVYAQNGTTDRVLVGFMPVQALGLSSLIEELGLSANADLHIQTANGDQLFELVRSDPSESHKPTYRRVTAEAMITSLGWQIVLIESWADLVPPILRFENIILLVAMMAVFVAILTIYFGLYNIIQPLRRLDAAAVQVASGNYDLIEASVGGVQEIEDLRLALARMASQIRQYQQDLQSHIGAITLGQEEERKRLARELHDETIQGLIALKQQVEIADRRLNKDPEAAAQRLRDLRPLISDTITGLRRLVHDLRPPYLEDLGFVPALEMLVKDTARRHDLIGDFKVLGSSVRRLPATTEISAYRIAQEALHNVANHARASRVHVELCFDELNVTLRVEDDGCGFDVPDQLYLQAQKGHYGLVGMQERAQLNGGTLHVTSESGKGTTVITRLPAQAGFESAIGRAIKLDALLPVASTP